LRADQHYIDILYQAKGSISLMWRPARHTYFLPRARRWEGIIGRVLLQQIMLV